MISLTLYFVVVLWLLGLVLIGLRFGLIGLYFFGFLGFMVLVGRTALNLVNFLWREESFAIGINMIDALIEII